VKLALKEMYLDRETISKIIREATEEPAIPPEQVKDLTPTVRAWIISKRPHIEHAVLGTGQPEEQTPSKPSVSAEEKESLGERHVEPVDLVRAAEAFTRAILTADKLKTHYADLLQVAEQWSHRLIFPKPALLRPHDPSGRLMIEFICVNGDPFAGCYPDMVMYGELGLEDEELFPFLKDHLKGDPMKGDLILDHYGQWHEKTMELKERCYQLFTRVEKDVRAVVERIIGDSWADLKGDSSTDLPWALAEWAYDTITVEPVGRSLLQGPCSGPWPLNVVEDSAGWSSICDGSLRVATLPSGLAATLMEAYESLVGRFKGYPEVEEIRKLVDEIGNLYLKLDDEFAFLINSRQVPGRCAYCRSPDRS
jgi:hypothetical protein